MDPMTPPSPARRTGATDRAPGRTRRQLLVTTAGGALLGSAWAQAFRETSGSGSTPTITIARERSALAALIEYRDQRLLVLDGSEGDDLQHLTELVTGITRQRVDVLLCTSVALAAIPVAFSSRWRITSTYALPDSDRHPQIQLEGRELRVDDLALTCTRLISGEWRRPLPSPEFEWYMSTRFHNARLTIASAGGVLGHISPDPTAVSALVCNDRELDAWPPLLAARMLVAPPEADVFDSQVDAQHRLLIPFHPRSAVTFRLTHDGIEPPSSY